MGGIVFEQDVLLDELIDIAGFKAGLMLTCEQVVAQLPDHATRLKANLTSPVRLRSEVYDGLVHEFLVSLGAAVADAPRDPMDLDAKYYGTPQKELYDKVWELWLAIQFEQMRTSFGQPRDLGPMLQAAEEQFGPEGLSIALEIYDLAHRAANESPWNRINRHVDWKNTVELTGLFTSTKLETPHGTFFDQRFIDYLHQNFESVDDMNWRKFEGLTAEYYKREGAHVVLGPGSNDGNIDARVYWDGDDTTKPAAILIQCKREKKKVGKVVVKALYADVQHENAGSGLIVTTQSLSPGAETTRVARGYPIDVADRPKLKEWLGKLRSRHLK
jgi:restriction system protein